MQMQIWQWIWMNPKEFLIQNGQVDVGWLDIHNRRI